MAHKILLVEDDPLIVSSLTELLEAHGYSVDTAATQDAALDLALPQVSYQLVLLDVTLAQGNGLVICGAIKQASPTTPVFFLTASTDEFSTVAGLELGADDYIAKPFRPRELLARIAGAIRRSQSASPHLITFGSLTIDLDRVYVERAGQELALSALEYRLLLLFSTHQGKLITRNQIREALWNEAGTYIEENTLSVYIKRLRNKIEDDPAHPQLIVTVRGMGYQAGSRKC